MLKVYLYIVDVIRTYIKHLRPEWNNLPRNCASLNSFPRYIQLLTWKHRENENLKLDEASRVLFKHTRKAYPLKRDRYVKPTK